MALPFPHPEALLPPGFTMSRATPEDAPGMTDVCESNMRAFSASPDFTYWWSSPSIMHAWNLERIRVRFADPGIHQFKIVDEANGKIVAFTKWDVPATVQGLREGFKVYGEASGLEKEGNAGGEVKKGGLKKPEGVDQELFDELFGGLKKYALFSIPFAPFGLRVESELPVWVECRVGALETRRDAREVVSLGIICTEPSYHGRGIGAALIQSVLAIADAEKVTAYLEAMPLAVPLYKRQGFVPVDTLEFDVSKVGRTQNPVLTIMVREPKSAA
ncbi:acyl-CoA N-acyltransferase [Annulohypoxylon nitens]|nr:acyl-CoA N-acyltransferase [Annulohypoxylon nitens]